MNPPSDLASRILGHYREMWGMESQVLRLDRGPSQELPAEFGVLLFAPSPRRPMWTYATQCMSVPEEDLGIELHMFAPEREDGLVELLTAAAHYHRKGARLDAGHTVNFGRPWWTGSEAEHALVSRPYLDGPMLEWLPFGPRRIRFLWLLPMMKEELQFKKTRGLEKLEQMLEAKQVNYLDPKRKSVV